MKSGISRLIRFAIISAAIIAPPSELRAQLPADALRLGTPGFGVGARALGMGNAYTGVANDYSAIEWNPAGLAQATLGEFHAGFSYFTNSDNSTFLGQAGSTNTSGTNLNSLGIVYPVPTRRGSLVLAFGFSRDANFGSGVDATGFNPSSSIIQSWARNGAVAPAVRDNIIPYQVYLADINPNGTWKSPITGQLTQQANTAEDGGLNNWSAGGALEIAKNISVGMTLNYLSGSYRYDRKFTELDTRGVYAAVALDSVHRFYGLAVTDFIEDDITGVNAKFGLMIREPDRYRFGFTIKTPTAFTVRESFNTTLTTDILDSKGRPYSDQYKPEPSTADYDVRTPWVFGAGGSIILGDLMVSADADYTDWTTLKFANANQDVIDQNVGMKTLFRAVVNLRAGAEYEIVQPGIRLRGGFMYNKSPYSGDPSTFDQKYVTGGLGFRLGEFTMLNIGYARGWWDTYRTNYAYADGARIDEKMVTNTFLMTLVVRY